MQLEDSDIKKRETVIQLLFSILDRNSNAGEAVVSGSTMSK